MSDISVYTLASSSKGNCTYIRVGEDEILIDAGISAKRICDSLKAIDTDISRIKAIFITHEHSDHVSGLETLSKKYQIPVHFTEPSARCHFKSKNTENTANTAVIHPILYNESVGKLTVSSFETPHDSAASVGYVVSGENADYTVAVATDMGYIPDSVSDALIGISYVILESNHDENMLLSGNYPYELKRRILGKGGHLSNEIAASFAARLIRAGTKRILLAHLSRENNLPELAYHSSLEAVGECGAAISVAAPDTPTQLI